MAARAQARGPEFLSRAKLHKFLGKILCNFTTCIFHEMCYNNYRKRGKRDERLT